MRVDPAPIKAVDQDVGISAPVRYSVQGGILSFLNLNPETADLIVTRPLQDHELVAPTTIVIKVPKNIYRIDFFFLLLWFLLFFSKTIF